MNAIVLECGKAMTELSTAIVSMRHSVDGRGGTYIVNSFRRSILSDLEHDDVSDAHFGCDFVSGYSSDSFN